MYLWTKGFNAGIMVNGPASGSSPTAGTARAQYLLGSSLFVSSFVSSILYFGEIIVDLIVGLLGFLIESMAINIFES